MLINFRPTTNPDNRFTKLDCLGDELDTLVIGADCTHLFKFKLHLKNCLQAIKVKYTQGLSVILQKDIPVEHLVYTAHETIFQVKLNSEETALFRETLLNSSVQAEFTLVNNQKIYSDVFSLNVVKPL